MDKIVFDFLSELVLNNNREWFAKNKSVYEKAQGAFLDTVTNIIEELSATVPAYASLKAKDTVFRIYRDVRFGKDKSPYKTHFGAYLAPGGRKSPFAGHYLHVEKGNCFLAGGIYGPDTDNLKAIRSEIYFNLTAFEEIINDQVFVDLFHEVKGNKLKRPPVGFPKDFEGIDLLKFKDFNMMHPIEEEVLLSPQGFDSICKVFNSMNRFNNFLNRGIENRVG